MRGEVVDEGDAAPHGRAAWHSALAGLRPGGAHVRIVGQANADGPARRHRDCSSACAPRSSTAGPDSRGICTRTPASGLGIQRLRVIDLETGDQPIFNEDRSVAVVLNGEIYNYRELRARAASAPATRFATQGDTEVIAHLYEEQGPRLRARACTGCSRWRCGTPGAGYCCSRATGSARSRSTTPSAAGRSASPPSSRRCCADDEIPREVDHAALDAYLAYR